MKRRACQGGGKGGFVLKKKGVCQGQTPFRSSLPVKNYLLTGVEPGGVEGLGC